MGLVAGRHTAEPERGRAIFHFIRSYSPTAIGLLESNAFFYGRDDIQCNLLSRNLTQISETIK